jgi:hypothetical protein
MTAVNNSLQHSTITPLPDAEEALSYTTPHLFGSPKWMKVLQAEYGINFFVIKYTQSDAFFPFAHLRRPGFEKIVSLPFSDYIIPSVKNETEVNELLSDLQIAYPEAKVRCDWIFPDNFNFEECPYDLRQTAYLHTVYTPDFKKVKKNMKSSFRNKIRQAKRHELTTNISKELTSVEEFYAAYHSLRIHKFGKIPQSFRFFKEIWSDFIKKDKGFVLEVKLDGTNIAFGVCLVHGDKIYFKFSCSKKEYLDYRPNNLLLSTLFKYACDNDFRAVDLGLSGTGKSYEGLVKFKESTGGVPSPIKTLEIIPDSYDAEAEKQLGRMTSDLTKEIVQLNPAPDSTSKFSEILYPYFA